MAIRKNKKRIDPRYFMDEKTESIISEGPVENLTGARVVGPQGLDAARGDRLAKPGQSIVVDKGWPGTSQNLLQVWILPKGAGFYEDVDQAKNAGFTGEAYYATVEDIANQTKEDAALGAQVGSEGPFSYGE